MLVEHLPGMQEVVGSNATWGSSFFLEKGKMGCLRSCCVVCRLYCLVFIYLSPLCSQSWQRFRLISSNLWPISRGLLWGRGNSWTLEEEMFPLISDSLVCWWIISSLIHNHWISTSECTRELISQRNREICWRRYILVFPYKLYTTETNHWQCWSINAVKLHRHTENTCVLLYKHVYCTYSGTSLIWTSNGPA